MDLLTHRLWRTGPKRLSWTFGGSPSRSTGTLKSLSVSRTVVELADLIEARVPLRGAREQLQLQILRQMPLYVQIRDLSAWEGAFTAVMEDEDAAEGSTLWMLGHVFDFGRCCMYAAFSEAAAKRDYEYMRSELLKVGVEVPVSPELKEW